MKKHAPVVQILTFFMILSFFILPSLFISNINNAAQSFSKWNFPVYQVLTGSFFLLFYIFYIGGNQSKIISKHSTVISKIIYISFTVVFTLSLLFFNCLIFKSISLLFPDKITDLSIAKPDSFTAFLFCLINFLFSACYEEVLYRGYLCDSVLSFFNLNFKTGSKAQKTIVLIIEIICTILFAIPHYYGGLLSVLNAVTAHIILRVIYLKTGNLYSNIVAHWLYNVLILFVF